MFGRLRGFLSLRNRPLPRPHEKPFKSYEIKCFRFFTGWVQGVSKGESTKSLKQMTEKCSLRLLLPSSLNEIMWECFTFAGGLVFMKEKWGGLYHFPFFRLTLKVPLHLKPRGHGVRGEGG